MLSAHQLDIFDRCERRFAYERDWESRILSPIGLLYRCLEGALPQDNPEESAKSIALKLAAKMELRTTALEPYAVACHMGALAGILATFIRAKLGILMPAPNNFVSTGTAKNGTNSSDVVDSTDKTGVDGYEWKPGTFEDSSGLRHRFVLCDHFDDDRLSSEAHSWATIGELAASGRPLTLHALIVGANRAGRRHSPWTKGFLHPANRQLRFGRRKGGKHAGLSGDWAEVWRESSAFPTLEWLRVMQEDGVLADLVVSRPVKMNDADPRLLAARREIVALQINMADSSIEAPMRRSSCDEMGRGPCPFQSICYSPVQITPAELPHLYSPRGIVLDTTPKSTSRPAHSHGIRT